MATADDLSNLNERRVLVGNVDVAQLKKNKAREEATLEDPAAAAEDGVIEATPTDLDAAPPRRSFRQRAADWGRALAHRLIYKPIARRLAKTDIRFVVSGFPHRIGHLAAEFDLLFKEIELGKRAKMRPIMLLAPGQAANDALLDVWRQKVRIIENRLLGKLLGPLLNYPDIVHYTTTPFLAFDSASPYPALLAEWGDRPPVVELPEKMRSDGLAALKRWGMRDDGWFVCVHNREPGYSPADEAIHRHRNANILNYREAMEEIVAQGGFVVRMGDPTMRQLPEIEGVYDYAHSEERAPYLDIFLASQCRFFVGTTSGLMAVATLFNRPCAMTNTVPYGMAPGTSPRDVSILKLLKDEQGRSYRFSTVFEHGVSRWRSAEAFRNARIHVVQNTPDEIRDLVLEMIERDEGRFVQSEDDRILQQVFLGHLGPTDYSYGSQASVGRAFLRKYAMFL
ncbi:MAG: TIGR04372 family glycosyltransferase [Neomegalonema sp.]|nr:TIGR04372 family glycosyltransferase [Neomegalonema sp.]